ncbi:uncharacterized protein LOC114814167 isoform X3 [Ornithorhynchus anatinus]|uniref:uncharacterized protein LOC114814167 isoform X3 n=1 Tax=Ornithorhynchus anatinus TaxID=9258 RepID=UPI0010A94176|nr:uncharacterized protein LOC114814167 isoform X3 [Ornithorhynchus anatinus]
MWDILEALLFPVLATLWGLQWPLPDEVFAIIFLVLLLWEIHWGHLKWLTKEETRDNVRRPDPQPEEAPEKGTTRTRRPRNRTAPSAGAVVKEPGAGQRRTALPAPWTHRPSPARRRRLDPKRPLVDAGAQKVTLPGRAFRSLKLTLPGRAMRGQEVTLPGRAVWSQEVTLPRRPVRSQDLTFSKGVNWLS